MRPRRALSPGRAASDGRRDAARVHHTRTAQRIAHRAQELQLRLTRRALGDVVLGSVDVRSGFAPYTFDIPPAVAAADATSGEPVRLTLETVTWNPAKVLGTPDTRDLGVMVDRVAVQ